MLIVWECRRMDVDCRMLIWESSFIWSVIAVSSNNLCLLLAFCRIYETDLQTGKQSVKNIQKTAWIGNKTKSHPSASFSEPHSIAKNMFEKRIRRQQMAQGFQGISGFQRVIGFSYFNRRRWNSENSNLSRMDIFWHNSRILKKWQKPAAFRDL